jgi:hypothetical protein
MISESHGRRTPYSTWEEAGEFLVLGTNRRLFRRPHYALEFQAFLLYDTSLLLEPPKDSAETLFLTKGGRLDRWRIESTVALWFVWGLD